MTAIFPESPQTFTGVEVKINCSYAETLLFVLPKGCSPREEEKREWNLSPVGKRPLVIRRAGFYLGFFVLGDFRLSKGSGACCLGKF